MDPQEISNLIDTKINTAAASGRFNLNSIPYHDHDNINSPAVSFNDLVDREFSVSVVVPGNLASQGGVYTVTGAFSGGETSATLTAVWPFSTTVQMVYFSNGDERFVTFTNGSANITWSGALSSAATVSIYLPAYYGPFFIAPETLSIQALYQQHTVNATDSNPVRLQVRLLKPGNVFGSVITSWDVKTGAQGVISSKLRPYGTAAIMDENDRLGLFMLGVPTSLQQVVVTVVLQINPDVQKVKIN